MRDRMGSVDAAWFRMDRPQNTADVVALLTFRKLPPPARIRELVERRLLPYACFRQRVVGAAGLAGDAWEDDPAFALEHHLARRRLRSRAPGALRDLVSELATEPLDPARPLWRLCLVEGPASGAIVAKLHHCLADGFALVGLLLSMADERAGGGESHHALAAYRRLAPWLQPGALLREVLYHPGRAPKVAMEASAIAAAVARMALLPPDPTTLLSRPLTGRRRVAWSHGLSLARAREAARAHGVTLNDVILAGVAGALRSYLATAGEPVDRLGVRALVPVNLRQAPPEVTSGTLGNQFGLVFLDLPTDLRARRARLDAVHQRTTVLKGRPDAIAAFGVLAALGRLPALAPWATTFFARKASVVITNVPGPRHRLHLAGHRIEHALFWVPHPATLGVGISVLTYAGEVRIGVRADEAVMPDPADLVARFEHELVAFESAAVPSRRAG